MKQKRIAAQFYDKVEGVCCMIFTIFTLPISRNDFVDKEKKEILSVNTSQNFALACMRFLASAGSVSSFIICFNVVELILF